jgi:hypothetical protein
VTQFGTVFQGGAHHGDGEGARVNNRGRFHRSEPRLDDYAVGEPIELGRLAATGVALGNDETAIGSHAAIAPIARNLVGQGGVKPEAPLRQCIKRGARAPVERQETSSVARGRSGQVGPFHDDDVDAPASEQIGGAGADRAAAADRDTHGFSADKLLNCTYRIELSDAT